jgi:hypothetical protein
MLFYASLSPGAEVAEESQEQGQPHRLPQEAATIRLDRVSDAALTVTPRAENGVVGTLSEGLNEPALPEGGGSTVSANELEAVQLMAKEATGAWRGGAWAGREYENPLEAGCPPDVGGILESRTLQLPPLEASNSQEVMRRTQTGREHGARASSLRERRSSKGHQPTPTEGQAQEEGRGSLAEGGVPQGGKREGPTSVSTTGGLETEADWRGGGAGGHGSVKPEAHILDVVPLPSLLDTMVDDTVPTVHHSASACPSPTEGLGAKSPPPLVIEKQPLMAAPPLLSARDGLASTMQRSARPDVEDRLTSLERGPPLMSGRAMSPTGTLRNTVVSVHDYVKSVHRAFFR